MARIAALIGYRPNPGSGASGLAAFTVAKGKTVSVPAGFRVGSKAQPPKTAAIFETSAALTAADEHNAIPLSPVAPTNQFARLTSFGTFFGPTQVDLSSLATVAGDLYGRAAPLYVRTFPFLQAAQSQFSASFQAAAARNTLIAQDGGGGGGFGGFGGGFGGLGNIFTGIFDGIDLSTAVSQEPIEPGFSYNPFTDDITRTIVFRGVNLGVKDGDQLLAVENEGSTAEDHPENATLHQVVSVATDKASNTTTVKWVEAPDQVYDSAQTEVAVYAFLVKAGVFGNTAPQFDALPADLTKAGAPFEGKNWDTPGNPWFGLPKPDEASQSQVLLDAVYDDANGTPQTPAWTVLLTDTPPDPFIAHVVDARTVSRSAFAISGKITRLSFKSSEKIPTSAGVFPMRTTTVLCGSRKLALSNNLPLPVQVSGDTLILSGVHKRLQAGQQVVLTGPLFSSNNAATPIVQSELRVLKGAPASSDEFGITTVILDRPLDNTYTRADSALLANVVEVTQGETVKDEVLGSGNGGASQSFALKKSPLTYLPSTDPNSFAAVESTLIVTVNGVQWLEKPELLDSAPDEQAFTTTTDQQGKTTVVFGDGFHGARPPSGIDNVHARYRKGIGTSGNVDPGGVQQLVDSAPGLQKVANPMPAGGGADPEDVAGIRRNAPAGVRSFGRAVSADDYAALALTFPGVGKAASVWITRDEASRPVIHPYIQLTVATADQVALAQQPTLASKLRRFLDQRRDPNVALRIVDFTPIFLNVAVTVDIDDRFPRTATLSRAQAALSDFFAFERLDLGVSIHLSDIYAALLAVAGVTDANVTTLGRVDDPDSAQNVQDTIFIGATEIAAVGSLIVNLGQGGFADQ